MSPRNTIALKESLASFLFQALEAIAEVARDQGIDIALPTATYDGVWFKDVGGHGQEKRITRSEPLFHRLPEFLEQLKAHEPARTTFENLAKEAASILESGSWPAAGGPQPSPDGLVEYLVSACLKLQLASKPDQAAIARICSAFVDDILSETITATSVYLVGNFSAPAEFQLDDHTMFRPIAMDDFEQFGIAAHGQGLGFGRPWLNTTNWICQASDDGPKDSFEAPNRRFDHIERVLGALNLTASGRVSSQLLLASLASPLFGGPYASSRNTLYSSGFGEQVALDQAGVERFKKNYDLVKVVLGEARLERLRLPFRRLRAASYRREDEDKIIDYVIGLERLLAPDTNTSEITFRFRLRGAAILPTDFGDATERKRFMSELYDLRSEVVHGKAEPATIGEMVPKAEAALKAVFLWFGSSLRGGDITSTVQKLDCALVDGASAWVESFR